MEGIRLTFFCSLQGMSSQLRADEMRKQTIDMSRRATGVAEQVGRCSEVLLVTCEHARSWVKKREMGSTPIAE